jgi:hypothetical protein
MEGQTMMAPKRYRILAPDGMLSDDSYVLSPEQPPTIKKGCVQILDDCTGAKVTVHETRLFPEDADRPIPVAKASKSVCMKCGKVQGVVEDQVACPFHEHIPCGLLEVSSGKTESVEA